MARWARSVGILGLMSACAITPRLAHAAEEATEDPDDAEEASSEATPKKEEPKSDAAADASGDDSPVEESGKEYKFVGLRYRGIIVPKFILNLFADGGRTVYVNAIGPEYIIRKDNFEFQLSPWLAFYSMDDTAFKGKTDPNTSWELINSSIKMLYLTADLVWSHPASPKVAINYGFGAGLGFTFGDLHRNQTYPNGQSDPNKYTKCPYKGFLDGGGYCTNPTDNNHFGNYTEPSWFNGGSKPSLFPWFAALTGVRWKPSRQFVGRLDVGFGLSGFFFGLGADYGL